MLVCMVLCWSLAHCFSRSQIFANKSETRTRKALFGNSKRTNLLILLKFFFFYSLKCSFIYLWYWGSWCFSSVQFSSVTQSCPTLCDPMDCSMPGLPVHHQLLKLTQTHVHWVGDAIQPSHPLSSPSPPAFNLSQHQGLFQWVSSSHQVAKVLDFQLQHQSFQWIFRTDFL